MTELVNDPAQADPDGTPAENPSGKTGEEVAEPKDPGEAERREGPDPA